VSNDPVERARLAWIGARFRFQRVVDRKGGEEEYRQAKADLERAKLLYDQLVARESRR
jgi:hypothetical protein